MDKRPVDTPSKLESNCLFRRKLPLLIRIKRWYARLLQKRKNN